MLYKKFANELNRLASDDLTLRQELAEGGKLQKGYHPAMESLHRANARRLREIMAEIGYPTISKVGEKASEAAWLIIQHAVSEPSFMQNCYQQMAAEKQDVNPANIAYLFDRIQCFKGKPQRFGTQLTADRGIYPVEDKNLLNERRLGMNLPMLSQMQIDSVYELDQLTSLDQQDADYTIWREKVGWI